MAACPHTSLPKSGGEARRQLGNVTAIRERTRDQWGRSSIDMLVHDVRYGPPPDPQGAWLQRGRDRVAGGGHWRVDGPVHDSAFAPVSW
jgi:hypothetical protein